MRTPSSTELLRLYRDILRLANSDILKKHRGVLRAATRVRFKKSKDVEKTTEIRACVRRAIATRDFLRETLKSSCPADTRVTHLNVLHNVCRVELERSSRSRNIVNEILDQRKKFESRGSRKDLKSVVSNIFESQYLGVLRDFESETGVVLTYDT